MRACACGLRSVWPQSIPGTIRSLAYANSPFTFGGASTRADELADLADLERARRGLRHARRGEPHRVEDLGVAGAAAEVAGERLADLVVATGSGSAAAGRRSRRRGPACRSRTAPRPRRRTPAARRAARRRRRAPRPSSRRGRRACAASTRQAQTSVPSSSTEHEPHSPCSHAFFEPGKPSFSRSAKSSDSPSQQSAWCSSPLIRTVILMRAPVRARARSSTRSACRR